MTQMHSLKMSIPNNLKSNSFWWLGEYNWNLNLVFKKKRQEKTEIVKQTISKTKLFDDGSKSFSEN